jgi:GTP-binding protein Era
LARAPAPKVVPVTEHRTGVHLPQVPRKPMREASMEGPSRSGRVALIGRPNVGKSTLLNAALEQPLTIVSPSPQTTRDAILGVVRRGMAEIALLDTPGLHRARTELGRVMNSTAREAARNADVVVFVVDVPKLTKPLKAGPDDNEKAPRAPRPLAPHPGDLTLLADIDEGIPTILVINKVDRIRDKTKLLPLLEALGAVRTFAAVVPISAQRQSGIDRLLDEIAAQCPEGPHRFGPDDITDRPTRFFAAEYVREQILHATQAEVPHSVAVTIENFVEPPGVGTLHIDATIAVERDGQKRILIGAGGEMLKRIGTQARLRIEELTGRKVNLKLWVRIQAAWRESREQLGELGYRRGGSGSDTEVVIEAELPEEAELEDDGDEEENEENSQ